MSVVTSAVIIASYVPREVKPLLTEPQSFGRDAAYMQAFAEIDASGCGGGKVLQVDIYAAGLNHIGDEELDEWFVGLPWGEHGSAVLIRDCEGDFRAVIPTPGWARTGQRGEATRMLASALRRLVNAPLPPDLDPEQEFWIAARNARAALGATRDLTGIDGEQDLKS